MKMKSRWLGRTVGEKNASAKTKFLQRFLNTGKRFKWALVQNPRYSETMNESEFGNVVEVGKEFVGHSKRKRTHTTTHRESGLIPGDGGVCRCLLSRALPQNYFLFRICTLLSNTVTVNCPNLRKTFRVAMEQWTILSNRT